jgi:hypothetical protein
MQPPEDLLFYEPCLEDPAASVRPPPPVDFTRGVHRLARLRLVRFRLFHTYSPHIPRNLSLPSNGHFTLFGIGVIMWEERYCEMTHPSRNLSFTDLNSKAEYHTSRLQPTAPLRSAARCQVFRRRRQHMRQQGMVGWRGARTGSCAAWLLPADETCAGIARGLFRNAVTHLGLEDEVLDDAILMTSELAANTLHARAVARTGGAPDCGPPVPGSAELWLYLRGMGMHRELVCKVFDCNCGWLQGPPSVESAFSTQSDAGRGLQIVHELSGGRWGYHPTRARLGGWGVRGKAVWFAVPAPFAHARAGQAARELQAMLAERGFGSGSGSLIRLVCSEEPGSDLSVLCVSPGLTLRCRSGLVSLGSPGEREESWSYADLVEAVEQTIRRYEELDLSRPELLTAASNVG